MPHFNFNARDRLAPNIEPPAPTRSTPPRRLASTLRLASGANLADTSRPNAYDPDTDAVLGGAAAAVADLEHLGGGHALGVGRSRPVARARPSGDGVHHAEDAADGAHRHR